jgi:catechol 2,3-dioxygenase-like lactoylglutathione lyase family enzyme
MLTAPFIWSVTALARTPQQGQPGAARTARKNIVNHIGQRVSNLDSARAFYEHALGFEFWRELKVGDAGAAKLIQMKPPLGGHNYYMRRGSFVVELMHFADSPPVNAAHRRTFGELGLTHISISVEDIPGTCKLVEKYGGQVLHDTDLGQAIMVRDPDGQFIELLPMAYAERVAAEG